MLGVEVNCNAKVAGCVAKMLGEESRRIALATDVQMLCARSPGRLNFAQCCLYRLLVCPQYCTDIILTFRRLEFLGGCIEVLCTPRRGNGHGDEER
jgi:hypothetical protein